jgi:phosphatidylserine decarboxylase
MPDTQANAMYVYDRRQGRLVREIVLGDTWLRLAYHAPCRPMLRWLLFRRRWASRLLGWYCDAPISRRRIAGTITALHLDPAEFRDPVSSFRSFNDFFTRHLRPGARPFDPASGSLSSPADARLLVYPRLEQDTCVPLKGAAFTVAALLKPVTASPDFRHGSLVVLRLCPADYHRYHYPAGGRSLRSWEIDGHLDSVHPVALALGLRVFVENWRRVELLDLEGFGQAAFVEIGAFGVGATVQTHAQPEFDKMDEKGYFKFGASTIVLVFETGRVEFDTDLVERSANGCETLVRAGETIGRAPPA